MLQEDRCSLRPERILSSYSLTPAGLSHHFCFGKKRYLHNSTPRKKKRRRKKYSFFIESSGNLIMSVWHSVQSNLHLEFCHVSS